MAGILYGVGVGPGDPDLMTIKAAKIIRNCEVIGIPARDRDSCRAYQIASSVVPEIADKRILSVPVPMTTDQARLAAVYDEGCQHLTEYLKEGLSVAFLNLGDPTVYGTYMELHKRVLLRGYETQIISGVPSFCAAAASIGVPLAAQKEKIHIIPGCYHAKEAKEYEGTLILMKSGSNIKEVKRNLIALEETGSCKVYAAVNCGMDNEKICLNIRELNEDAGYFTTIIVRERS